MSPHASARPRRRAYQHVVIVAVVLDHARREGAQERRGRGLELEQEGRDPGPPFREGDLVHPAPEAQRALEIPHEVPVHGGVGEGFEPPGHAAHEASHARQQGVVARRRLGEEGAGQVREHAKAQGDPLRALDLDDAGSVESGHHPGYVEIGIAFGEVLEGAVHEIQRLRRFAGVGGLQHVGLASGRC